MTIARVRSKDRKPSAAPSPPPRPGRDAKPTTPTPPPKPKPKPTAKPPACPVVKPPLDEPSPQKPPPESNAPQPLLEPAVAVQEKNTLPEVPLTRADMPAGVTPLLGVLRHGIDPWRGAPYVFLQVKASGRILQVGWRHTWGLDEAAVTHQHPFGNKTMRPIWAALDLSTDAKREMNRRVLELSRLLRAAFRAAKPPKPQETQRGDDHQRNP